MLERIKSPRDVQALTPSQCEELAGEIRGYLVDSVSRTGGHLGPNLGVVELTIALHRVFESPQDTIVFDTGHQAYVHKMLTGRTDFSTLKIARRSLRLPVARGERARCRGELPRVDCPVVGRRHCPRQDLARARPIATPLR